MTYIKSCQEIMSESKPVGDPVGFAILIGIIIGVGVLFMAFAIFYKFVVLDPTERWNYTGRDLEDSRERDTASAGGLPQSPYPNNTVVPAPRGLGAYSDVELGEVSAFNQHHNPGYPDHEAIRHQRHKPTATPVVPVVEAVLYESDAEAPHTNNSRSIQVVDVHTTDARAQAMRDWYDS